MTGKGGIDESIDDERLHGSSVEPALKDEGSVSVAEVVKFPVDIVFGENVETSLEPGVNVGTS